MFIVCQKCGKKLIERLPNGIWRFRFGKRYGGLPVVDMEISGSLKMLCIKRTCRHVNILNYFPNTNTNTNE